MKKKEEGHRKLGELGFCRRGEPAAGGGGRTFQKEITEQAKERTDPRLLGMARSHPVTMRDPPIERHGHVL